MRRLTAYKLRRTRNPLPRLLPTNDMKIDLIFSRVVCFCLKARLCECDPFSQSISLVPPYSFGEYNIITDCAVTQRHPPFQLQIEVALEKKNVHYA